MIKSFRASTSQLTGILLMAGVVWSIRDDQRIIALPIRDDTQR